jgi:predicted RNase H-like HicB family nuclease
MPVLTATEDYVIAALRTASFERLDDGSVGATVPLCPGVIAFGADVRECLMELYTRLDDYVRVSLAHGRELPSINGISPSTPEEPSQSPISGDTSRTSANDFYENEDQLEAAFRRRSRPA